MGFIGTGVYPLRQAARLVGADPVAVRRWMLGYTRRGKHYGPLWVPEINSDELGEPSIGFRDLLELRLVAAFEHHGVSLRVIRSTADFARQEFGTDYPLTARRFLTDGKTIFLEAVKSAAEAGEMLDVPKRQLVFSEIVRPSLYAGVEYDTTSRARRWFPLGDKQKGVVLDPRVQFGSPIVASAGIPTDTIHATFLAEGRDRKAVARIFRITPPEVDAAVRFETKLAA